MEKAFDRVPREVVYWSLRKKGVSEKIVRLVRSMYVDAKTGVRIGTGNTGGFEIRVGVHQGSCISPLLFIIVMAHQSISAGRFHGTCCMQMTSHWRSKLRRGCKTVLMTGKGHWSARDLK